MPHLLIESTEIISIIAPIVAMLVVPAGMALADGIHRRVTEKQNGTISGPAYRVRHNSYTRFITIILTIVFGIITLLFPILYFCELTDTLTLGFTIITTCVVGFIAMMCALMLIAFTRWSITVSEERLVFTPHFGKRITLTWKDISNLKSDKNADTYQILINKFGKRIYFNPKIMIGGEKFLNDLKNHGVLFIGTYL